MLAALNLITEILQAAGELGAVDGGRKLLRAEQAPRVQSSGLAVLAVGDVEDDGMGVELGRGVAFDGRAVSCSNVAAANLPVSSGAFTLPSRAWVYRSNSPNAT